MRQLNVHHLRNHATEAVARRLGYPAPDAVRDVARDDTGAVIIRLNSGGNALAVIEALSGRGYAAEDAGTNPDGYGCAVRITAPSPLPSAEAVARAAYELSAEATSWRVLTWDELPEDRRQRATKEAANWLAAVQRASAS